MKQLTYLLTLCAILAVCAGSRILLSAPFGSKSHQNMFIPLIKELAKRGHHITFITNYESSELTKVQNVRQIAIPELIIDLAKFPNPFKSLSTNSIIDDQIIATIRFFMNSPREVTEATYSKPEIKEMIANDRFDLVMMSAFSAASFPFAWHFKTPIILISPCGLFTGMTSLLGDDEHFSYVPLLMSSFTDRMNLFQRTLNTVISNVASYVINDLQYAAVHSVVKEVIFPDCPPFNEIGKNVSLILINSHPTFTYPRSLPPQVIEMGGPHCRPPNPLEAELEAFVSGSKDGFIVFSVGSFQRMDDMPEKTIQPFIKAFSRLPQRVIWQWKGKPRPDFPPNVFAMPWIPQQDLLGHKDCRLFMTHGGLNSLQEAIYHGVPVLGLPLGGDQHLNMMRAVRDGYGLHLDWNDVTEDKLNTILNDLINTPSYKKTVDELSVLFRDQLETPLERAVYWTEFVLRHNGTDHLRLGSRDLSLLQRNLVDVYIIMFLIAAIPVLLTVFCARRCCCRKKQLLPNKTADSLKKRQ